MAKKWTSEEVLTMARLYQPACVLGAAAELDVFTPLCEKQMTAHALASELGTDLRATTILLDALVALELLTRQSDVYSVPENVAKILSEKSSDNVLPMIRHMFNCFRRWVLLADVTKTGKSAERTASTRGEAADQLSFIGGMHNLSWPIAAEVVNKLKPLKFDHLLDVGGASGTWTIAFLNAVPQAKATLFDLPPVVSMAERCISEAGLSDRVTLVPGDFYTDSLPEGADMAWLGAICHQNSRQQNRTLFAKIHKVLQTNGTIVIRDVVMDSSHTSPKGGALFAVNMLVNTPEGGTYSFDEYKQDLNKAGFTEVELVCEDEFMNSLIRAKKVKK
ncbi:MAG: methyltransferase domain-containing protein [Sedimentisphaerales bacterium]|nr:methyltransferase domain-containing protein [Sedimentisphaerales bacterium]